MPGRGGFLTAPGDLNKTVDAMGKHQLELVLFDTEEIDMFWKISQRVYENGVVTRKGSIK